MVEKQPRKLADFGKLTKAEQQVLDELDTGEVIRLGDGEVPPEDTGEDRQLRARFLRWLALGGDDDHRLHEQGLQVRGAQITRDGPAGAATPGLDLAFFACCFVDPPLLRSARLQNLFLDGSILPGLSADRLETRGGFYLRRSEVAGEVRMLGAQIGGDLSCIDAKVTNPGGRALSIDRAEVTGNLFLRGAEVTGEVRLLGARIGGDLDCVSAKITNAGGWALNADGVKVAGSFFLGKRAKIDGLLDLARVELGAIADDPACWPEKTGDLALNRCRYGAFTGGGINAADRIRWLALQSPARFNQDFWPQPYEQCAKVFRKMEHLADAEDILIEKEKLQRANRWKRIGNPLLRAVTWLAYRFLGATVRYGRKPVFALWWLLGFWLFSVVVFHGAWQAEAFKPNNAFVLRADEWGGCSVNAKPYAFRKDTATASQLGCFLAQPEAKGFPEFNAGIYALNVLFPGVQFEQQVHWVPDEDIRPVGLLAKRLVCFLIAAGCLLSVAGGAALGGLIKSD